MAEGNKSIFRQKALDRISSPEELDRYLQVTKPSTWITLCAVVVLLLGFVGWGIFGRLTTVQDVAVVSTDGRTVCFIPESMMGHIKADTVVQIAGKEYALMDNDIAPIIVNDSVSDRVRLAGRLAEGEIAIVLNVEAQLEEGVYTGRIEVESVTPISFIMN